MTNTVSESTILPISEIAILFEVNIRELDTDYVSELMQAQFEYGESHWQTHWKEKPKINQDGVLFSGFHTITAAKRNFGNDHEVSFQVVEGDPYLLAACENAVHGKRRTNADKRSAVLRWLQDDEGRQWTDSHIAKQCHVSDFLVNSVDVSLQENGSDTYDRPTKRRYIDKHGNVSWMETAKINDSTGESQAVVTGKKTAGEVLREQTKTSDEGETGENVSEETLKGLWKLVTAEMKAWKARDKEKCRFPSDHIGKASKSMLITALRKDEARNGKATAAELRDLLRLMKTDTFSFTLRVRETLKSTEKAAIDLECAHGNAEDARRRVWIAFGKSDISQSVGKKDFALAAAKHHDLNESGLKTPPTDDYSSAENYLLGEDYAPIDKLSLKEAQQLRAFFNLVERAIQEHPDWVQALLSETETPNATDAEEVSPMDPVWDVFNEHYPKWKAKYAESGCDENALIQASTESELLDALRVYRESDREGMPTADEVKDMINLMKQQSYPLARHLRNLLRAEVDAQDEGETEQDPFHDLDLATVKADLEALIKKVMPPEKHPLWHQICEDINDAYLDYENLPNDREIFAILLDCALTAIDELT